MSKFRHSWNRDRAVAVVLAAAALLIIGSLYLPSWITTTGQATPLKPEQAVEQAWQRARDLGRYQFTTNLETTISPTGKPVAENSARYERLFLEGQVDLPAQQMDLTIWEKGGNALNTRQGIQVRLEGGKAYGRVGNREWQEMEATSDAFAPDQDPMAFLAGATDITQAGTGRVEIPLPQGMGEISYTRYHFNLDGIEFARNMRSQLERQMAEAGDLPPGATVDVTQAFRELSGQGEVWIDSNGLPLRLMVDVEQPELYGEVSRSHIKTDFSGFPAQQGTGLALVNRTLTWARNTLNLPAAGAGWGEFGLQAGLFIGCLLLVLILVGKSRSRPIYIACAVVIIVSMLVSPIWSSHKTLAFTEKIQTQRREAEAQQAMQQAVQQGQASPAWDPLQDPLAGSAAPPDQLGEQAGPTPLMTFGGAQAIAPGEETPNDPNGDTDLDGLTNLEETHLGTDPTLLNSDLDALGDGLEVSGFDFNGLRYHTNPLTSDTTGDGLVDSLECWTTIPDTLPTNDIGCNLDSDSDSVLDIFEADNDNDGVDDDVDLSPSSKATGLSGDNPFMLTIEELEPEPVLVDLQIRPTNPEHLAYTMSVLDWPTGDTQGQIQRVLGNTFATAADNPMSPEDIATDPRGQYGDIRLIPMLEIRVPYKEGHTRNLPVKPGYSGTLESTTPLEEWLDTDKLELYGMYAHYLDANGTLGIYLPLTLVEDSLGASDVAFQAHFYYEPQADGDWGNAHQMRVIWWIQVLTDQCDSSAYDENTDGEFEAWCALPENRIETSQIVHTYPEEWSLTGLSIREDYGLEAVVAFEDPDTDTNVNDDDPLWKLANGLDGAFLSARDTEPDDGIRDVTVDEIARRFDNRTNEGNGIPEGDDRLWNIPKRAFQAWNQDLPHADYMITLVTTTTMQILDQKYLLPAGCQSGCTPRAVAPLLLTATEAHARTANLDFGGTTIYLEGANLTVNMDPSNVSLDTIATVSWVPYRYGAEGWEVYPADQYLQLLYGRLDSYLPRDPQDPESVAQVPGQKLMVYSYYLGLAQGASTIVQSGTTVNSSEEVDNDVELTFNNGVEAFYRSIEDITTLLEVNHNGMFRRLTEKERLEKNFADIDEFVQSKVKGRNGKYTPPGAFKYKTWERFFAGVKIFTLALMALVAISCAIAAWTTESDYLNYVQASFMAFCSTALLSLSLGQLIGAKLGGTGIRKTISNAWHEFKLKSLGVVLATIALAVDILAKIGLFVYEWITGDVKLGSIEWWNMFAQLMASIVVTAILFAIYLIPVIGEIIYAIISVINAVLEIVCTALGEEFEESKAGIICGGVSGMLSTLLYLAVYSLVTLSDTEYESGEQSAEREDSEDAPNSEFQVTNTTSFVPPEGGLTQSSPDLTLDNPLLGFQVGNSLAYAFLVTNTIRVKSEDQLDNWKSRQWSEQFNEENLKKSSYKFLLTRQETDAHDDLYLGKDTDWTTLGVLSDVPYAQIHRPMASQQNHVLSTSGINQAVSTYYNLGYDLPVQQCWGWPWPPVSYCSIEDTADTGHSEIGQYFLYDVFPADLDGFYTLHAGSEGYRLAWGGSALQFPVLKDADGDGLAYGSDPGDATRDYDRDSLSDAFEKQIGTNPRSEDSDNDGAFDREELLFGANPNIPDSDHDGLWDELEITGWDFVYGWVDEHTPKIIHVYPDPMMYDSDFDGLSDHKEWLYGWNPRAVSEGEVLTFSSDLAERDAGGQYSGTDGVVRYGDQLRYEAEVQNALDLRYMRGLLSAEYPAGSLGGSVDPKTFLLAPREPATISGDLTVTAASSGLLNLTQIAGAELYQANASSNYLSMLYHLEEPASATVFLDESGGVRPNHGTCPVGSCPDQRVTGIVGQAVQFTALGQRIDSSTVDISRGSFTAMLWVKTSSPYVTLMNIGFGNVLFWINTSGQVEVDINQGYSSAGVTSTAAVNDNLWHHLAVTYAESAGASTLSLYIDGSLAVNSVSGLRTPGEAGLTIGRNYIGDLDEVAVYSRALTEAEIQDTVLKSRAALDAHLDEPANARVFVDASGQNSGTCHLGQCPKMGVPGMNRTAAEFDGLDDAIEFPHTPSLDFPASQDFSVVLWVKPGAKVDTTLIKTGEDAVPLSPLTYNIPFQISYVGSTHSIQAMRQDRWFHTRTISATVAINDGQFHHVAYVKQGGTLSLYIDGVQRESADDIAIGVTKDSTPLYIGRGGYYDRYFAGQIDGVRVYRRSLSQIEIQELLVSDLVALDLQFDDPPGTYQFQDANGQPPASCPSSLAGCPTSGVPGRWNLATLFDGVDDSLDAGVAPAVISTNPFSLAAWVRTTAAKDQVIVNQRSATVYNGEYMFGLTAQGKVSWFTYGNSGAAGFSLVSAGAVNDGKWHHVAAVRDVSGSAFIYIDGLLDASLVNTDPTKIAPLVATNVYIGADLRDHAQYFNGMIDDLQIRRAVLSAAEVLALVNMAPRFLLHMEEAAGANSFADDTELGYNATCSGTSCPKAGVNGQVGLAAEFDGLDDGLRMRFDLMNHEGTVMVWVRPNSSTNLPQAVIASVGEDIKLYRENGTWKLRMNSSVVLAPAEAKVRPEKWQHLAIVLSPVGAGTTGQLYLDGAPVSDVSPDAAYTLRLPSIGYDINLNNQHFDGRIDEVTTYNRALSLAEVKAVFDYQAGWVQQVQNTGLIVDNDLPTVSIALPGAFIANQPTQFRIETSDISSPVRQVNWRVNGGTWSAAPPCQGADFGSAWCPTLTPGSPGSYKIDAQATDTAGNTSTIASASLQIDDTAPNTTLAQEGALVPLQPTNDRQYSWIASLSGSAVDLAPGSGVGSVQVSLIDPQGVPLAGGSQAATVSGETWSVNYLLPEPLISGRYTVQLEAEDKVGNHSADRMHIILLDRTAPEAAFDGPPPGGALVLWRLNDPSGATRFTDSSGLGNEAMCDLSCPLAGVTGKYGTGLQLTGGSSIKTNRPLAIGDNGLALSAWFKTGATTQQTLLALTDATNAKTITVKLDTAGKVLYAFSSPGGTTTTIQTKKTFNNNVWHHLSAQWQPGQIQLYLDGQLVRTSDAAPGSLPPSLNLVIGQDGGADPFTGFVDEAAIHGVHLTSAEVRSLAFIDPTQKQAQVNLQGTISELDAVPGAMLTLHLEEAASPFVDSSDYDNDAACTGAECPTVDISGPYGASRRFDGIDDGLTIQSSSLNSLTNTLTVMAWVKPEKISGVQRVLGIAQCSAGGGLGFGLGGSGLIFTTYSVKDYYSSGINLAPNQWQHIAAVMGADNGVTFYVNGIERQTIGGVNPSKVCQGDIQIGRSIAANGLPGQWFQGSIDEIQVFSRSLTAKEIQALAQKQLAGIKSLEVAYISDLAGSTHYNADVLPDTQLGMPLDDTESSEETPTFLDTSGTGHRGSCTQPNCPSSGQAGHSGSAAMFDASDVITVPALTSDGTTDFYTISAWIYPVSVPSGTDTFLSRDNWAIARYSDGFIRWVFRSGSTNNTWYNTGYKPEVGKWTHIAVVFDAGVVKTYANGVLKHTYPTPPDRLPVNVSNNSTLNIGSWPAYSQYFNGKIDDVTLISRALTDSEIMALHLGTEPVLHLPFDESWLVNGSALADQSGWEQTAILNGGSGDVSNKALQGQVGAGALLLDGVDDQVEVSNQTSLNFSANQDFSVSIWVKAEPQVDTQYEDNDIVEKWSGAGGYPYVIRYVNSSGHIYAARYDGKNGPTVSSTTAINDNQFHHVVFLRHGDTLYLYIDGVVQGSVADTTNADTTNTSPLFIGARGNRINHFKGAVDDLVIYARGLSAEEIQALYAARWRPVTLSSSGSTVMISKWSVSLPAELEGHYQVEFRSEDNFGNRLEGRSAWDGVLDTTAPRATLTYEGGPTTYTYRFSAQDWNLDEGSLQSPCPPSTVASKTFFNPPWYRAMTGVTTIDSTRLYTLEGSCQAATADPTQQKLTVCDQFGNCSVLNALPATAAAISLKPASQTGQVIILTPAPGAIVNNRQAMNITGSARAETSLKRLTVSVDGKKVLNQKFDKRGTQSYDWSASWTPTQAGTHRIEAALTDWKNAEVTHSITFTLDTAPPEVTIATEVLTGTHVVNSHLPIWGTTTDENGLAKVEVRVQAGGHGSDWIPATLEDTHWRALVYVGSGYHPDSESFTVEARATDRAGWTMTINRAVLIDLQPPSLSDMSLSYDALGGTYPITQTETVVTDATPTMHLRWSPGSDGAGLAEYQAGWVVREAGRVVDTIASFSPGDALWATYPAKEAQLLTASLTSIDQLGNRQSQSFGPIYVDSPLTPDYIELNDTGEPYHGWMENGCSLLGQDRRINRTQPDEATRGQNQALYATWDTQALRLAWTGANWSGNGDLFVYLDTSPGGTLDAMNPFTTTVSLQLPGVLPVGPRPNAMYADAVVWVQDDQTAWLYRWDGTDWAAAAQLGSDRFRFDPGLDGGTTDLYLPFEMLGISNPESTPLKVVAMASEEGSLQLWAILPQSNPVTSPYATGRPRAEQAYVLFALNHPFSWDRLSSGTCPNGSQALRPNQRQFTDDDLQISLTADPAGASYRYLGDHLFGWWLTLFKDKPAEFSSMLANLASELDRVRDGQEIGYTIHYRNDGAQTAQDVTLQLRSRLALTLPDGVPQATGEHVYIQEISLGDVAPGQSGKVTVRGVVDLDWAESGYQACLALQPAHPQACEFAKRWALLGVLVYDQAHTPDDGPRELLWVDHRVDSSAPLFTGIARTAYGLSAAGNNTLRGYAYDESGVGHVKLEIVAPNGSTTQLDCQDPTPSDGQWACGLNLDPAAQDGDFYRIRILARDGVGLESAWSPWETFIVDRTPQTVTVGAVPTHTVGSPPVSLSQINLRGQIRDNIGVSSVEICQGSQCATSVSQYSTREWNTLDELTDPLTIGDCNGGGLQRTFMVAEEGTIGEIRLGFQAEIANRDRLVVKLTSPSGMSWQLIGNDFDPSTNYSNLSVILSDQAEVGVSDLRSDQALTAEGFGASVRPMQPLSIFRGQAASGAWMLSVCQEDSQGEPAFYHGAQLWVEPPNTAPLSGSWQTAIPLKALDDEEQTLLVYGIDEAGNRSPVPETLTFQIDNVTPEINVTKVISQINILPDLSPQTVLEGNVTDGGQIVRMHGYFRDPEGVDSSMRPVVNEDLSWQMTLQPMLAGTYLVWVAAEDQAGNLTTAGPFEVEVGGIVAIPSFEIAPRSAITPTVAITSTQTTPPTITPAPIITDTVTPMPLPTETPLPVPLPDATSTPIPPATVFVAVLAPLLQWSPPLSPISQRLGPGFR